MVRPLVILWTAVVSLSLAAQPGRVATPQPISAIRTGIVSAITYEPIVASNGSSFLISWADDRFDLQSVNNQGYSSSLLMRVDADGTSLDEFPIAIPFLPVGIVWTGSEWITAGVRTLARISAEGTILELRPIAEPAFIARGLAWAGNGLVVVGVFSKSPTDYSGTAGLGSLTFDAQLHLVASARLTTTASQIVATAGDGQSAITLWRDGSNVSKGTALHAASFGPDGLVQRVYFNRVSGVPSHPRIFKVPIGATGKGYVVLYPDGSTNTYTAIWIERDLNTRSIPLNDALGGVARSLAWDGTSLTFYSSDPERRLLATRFSADGFLTAPARQVGVLSSTFPDLAAAGIVGKTIVAYGRWDTPLKFRIIAPPAFPDSPEHSPVGAGPLPQDFPAEASNPSHSVVVWRERTAPSEWAIYATRLDRNATVLDPDSMLLASSSCDNIRPAVATDGENYLVAWHDKEGIATASIRADGSFTKRVSIRPRYGLTCSEAPLKLVSNGTDYLLLWVEKLPKSADVWDLFALRLRADGSIIGYEPIAVGKMNGLYPSILRFYGASNSQDYLIAWDGAAVRVTSEGVLLDISQKILLGTGSVLSLWWNGKTYIAQTTSSDGFRFLRIGSDGSGGRSPLGPQVDPAPFPPGVGDLYIGLSACDSSGCWVGCTARHTDGHDTLAVLRFEDDGTQITLRRHDVANVSMTSVSDMTPAPASIVNAGRPAFLFLPQLMERPFSSVHRLMIAPFAVPRGRAARHP